MMRARAIMWVQVMQPLRVVTKSNDVEMSPMLLCGYLQHTLRLAERMESGDVDFLLDSTFTAFDFSSADTNVSMLNQRYRDHHKAATKVCPTIFCPTKVCPTKVCPTKICPTSEPEQGHTMKLPNGGNITPLCPPPLAAPRWPLMTRTEAAST